MMLFPPFETWAWMVPLLASRSMCDAPWGAGFYLLGRSLSVGAQAAEALGNPDLSRALFESAGNAFTVCAADGPLDALRLLGRGLDP